MQKRKIRSSLTFLTLSKVKSVNRQAGALILCLLVAHSFTIVISNPKIATKTVIPPVVANNCDEACWYEMQNASSPETRGMLRSGMPFGNNLVNEGNQSDYSISLINDLRRSNCLILRL
jgi:hypothetical protein